MTRLPDGTQKAERSELPSGEKYFDMTVLPDGTIKIGRDEFPNGQKKFDATWRPNGTETGTAERRRQHKPEGPAL